MTGALIPDGTDAVVMQEQAEVDESGRVRIDSEHRVGENIRQAGEDIRQGDAILDAGVRLSPADLGVLASLGLGELQVKRKPTIAFFSTGDELVSIGNELAPGKIYDSNRYSLHGLLSRLAVDIIDLGVIPDDPDSMRDILVKTSIQADMIISTGGVSVGEADYIESVLGELGEIEFNKVAIKPGRPLTMAQIKDTVFMGLPGNPVAVMVTFSQFVMPAIDALCGARPVSPPVFRARSLEKMRKKPGRHEFQRGIASRDDEGRWQVAKTGKQGSGHSDLDEPRQLLHRARSRKHRRRSGRRSRYSTLRLDYLRAGHGQNSLFRPPRRNPRHARRNDGIAGTMLHRPGPGRSVARARRTLRSRFQRR